MATTGAELAAVIAELELSGQVVVAHVSLRSFPKVAGGPATLVDAFLAAGCTLVMPTMANDAFAIPAPANDRPRRNGTDYAARDESARRSPWPGLSDTYDRTRTDTDDGLGATSAYLAARRDRIRCALPARHGAGDRTAGPWAPGPATAVFSPRPPRRPARNTGPTRDATSAPFGATPSGPTTYLRVRSGLRSEELPRPGHAFQLVLAAVDELDPGPGNEIRHRTRNEHLTSRCQRADARSDMDGDAS